MLKLLLIDLGLINTRLKDIKNDIDESLNTEFTRGFESNTFFQNLESKTQKIEESFFKWNKELRKVLMTSNENTDKETLVKDSKNTSSQLQRINEIFRRLRKRAETAINYKHYSYEELKNTYLPMLETTKFTPTKNIVRFIRTIIEKTKDTNLTEDILIRIIKKRTSKDVYKNLKLKY